MRIPNQIITTPVAAASFVADRARAVDWQPLQMRCARTLSWFAKVLHIRQRYVLTKDNRLRLRYIASGFCLVSASALLTLTFSQNTAHSKQTQDYAGLFPANEQDISDPAEEAFDSAQKSLSDMLDTRLYGRFSLGSVAVTDIPEPREDVIRIKAGDALGKVMQDRGVPASEVHRAIVAMDDHFDPRHIKVGQEIAMNFDPTVSGEYLLKTMRIAIDPVKSVVVERDGDDFKASLVEKDVQKIANARYAEIETSVFGSAAKAGIPKGIVADVIRIYSWDVDFQRDIRTGDGIEVLYETFETEDGYVAKTGDIRYAKLVVGGQEKPVYRYEMADGTIDYFDPDGRSIKKTLMKTPIDGARMSSGFGMRHHPILGYNKMHKGVDFAASTGTPIYAAGDGVIERAGRNGGYGNYVRIRHNGTLKTAYAHMSKFKSGISTGKRVKQGDVIGYVGTSGRSTGPHLHYEVLENGRQVNPRSVDLPIGEELTGRELASFKSMIKKVDREYASVRKEHDYAAREGDTTNRKM